MKGSFYVRQLMKLAVGGILLSGCAYGVQQSRGDLHLELAPGDFRFAVVDPVSEGRSRIDEFLRSVGYLTLDLTALRELQTREIGSKQVLRVKCLYLGHVEKDALGTTAAQVSCSADDAVTGSPVYTGLGENVAMTVDGDISGAITAALKSFPRAGNAPGRVASVTELRSAFPPRAATSPETGAKTGTAVRVGTRSLVTNFHVVSGCEVVRDVATGATLEVSRTDPTNDLALLIDSSDSRGAGFRGIPGPRAGDDVVVLGFPLSGILSSELQVTTGVISALSGINNDTRLIQLSAPVQPGNSGGPVLDRSGRLIGIVVSKLAAAEVWRLTGALPENVNFAIAGDIVRRFLELSGVQYDLGADRPPMPVADIVTSGRQFTVALECR
jgi:S1-C subfamily serine protease